MPSLPVIAPFLGATGRMMSYRKNFSEAAAIGFISALLFTVFSDPVINFVDFGEKWLGLSGLPYQMNSALLGFIVGFGTYRILLLMRIQILKMLLNYQGWMTDPKSTTTKMWALMLNALKGTGNYPTFFFQPMLPKLPVPDFNQTCDKFITSMRPLLSEEDFMNLLTAMISFKEKEGPILQNRLLQKAQSEENWLKEIWQNLAYLQNRIPIAVNVNCYATDRKDLPTTNRVARASNLIHYVLSFYESVWNETLRPQYLQDMIPICMNGYKQLFSATRIPGDQIDHLQTYPESRHIIVIRKGNFYKLDAFAPDSDGKERLLTVTEIHSILEPLIAETETSEADSSRVAVFTAQKRDYWAKIRNRLVEIPENKESLEIVESAIAMFSFDDESPKTIEENGMLTQTGSGMNRWFDKINFPIFENAKVGVNFEHGAGDGTLPARMWEYFLQNEKYNRDGGIIAEKSKKKKLPTPQRLSWKLEDFENDLDYSMEEFKKLAGSFELCVISPEYGKGLIKKKRLSPDGFIQMALQLAYYRLCQKIPKTYESASTRLFHDGRTETIRPVSEFSAQWVRSMQSERATREQKIMLLRKAVQYQTQNKIDASTGKGWDRHLLGLFAMSLELQMSPALFQDKSFWMKDTLSTSQTPTNYTNHWTLETSCMGGGFFATCPEGYGVSYMIYGDDLIKFHVSSNKYCSATSSAKMADAIVEAMNDMRDLLS